MEMIRFYMKSQVFKVVIVKFIQSSESRHHVVL
jgi:hypothetical protein